ncbi:hypothetical protein ACE6H2_002313 [Prunus campanulata]
MTMVPAAHQNLSKQHHRYLYSGYGGCGANYNTAEDQSFGLMSTTSQVEEGYEYNYYCCNNNSSNNNNNINSIVTESDHLHHHLVAIDPMAEDESRTNSVNEAGSSSKDAPDDRDNEGWLQLTIGGSNNRQPAATVDQTPRGLRDTLSGPGLIELDLLPPGHDAALSSSIRQVRSMSSMQHHHMPPMFLVPPEIRPLSSSSSARLPFHSNFSTSATSLYFQHPGQGMSSSSSSLFPHHEGNWQFRPTVPHNNIGMASTSSSSYSTSSFTQLGSSYFPRPLHHQYHHDMNVPGPSLDFRVVDPPRRPQSGIWFMLQASQNQEKEPFLPQIPKSYLRIKDRRMTIRLIKKYLVNKLRLDSESEVEITCRGQQLLPFLTLQHVRDNIWSLREAPALLPDSSTTTTDHVMVLHYARTASTSASN